MLILQLSLKLEQFNRDRSVAPSHGRVAHLVPRYNGE